MINVKENNGHVSVLELRGELGTLAADLCVICKAIVEGIKEENEEAAKHFVKMLTDNSEGNMLIKLALESGIDDTHITELAKKAREDMGKDINELEELKNKLKGLLDELQ